MIWAQESIQAFTERALRPVGPATVEVKGQARVHLGSIDLSSAVPRGGGLGFSVPELQFTLRIQALGDSCESPPLPPSLQQLPMFAERAKIDLSNLRIDFESRLPEHRGLGSTTQYLVALLQGCQWALGRPLLSVHQLARIGIGAESSLGVRLAFDGRPLLDLGASSPDAWGGPFMRRQPRPRAFRLRFPREWRALIAWPREMQGLDATADSGFWARVLPVPEDRTLSALSALLTDVLPAIFEPSFDDFIRGLARFNQASSKPEEWDIQPNLVRHQANLLADIGYTPLLSSVGPAIVVFGPSRDALSMAESKFNEEAGVWQHVTTQFVNRGRQ